jgi:hypothetical protein
LEVEVRVIREFSKSNSSREVVSHRNENTSLADVSHITLNKIVTLKSKFASEFKDFVSHVSFHLSLSVHRLEVSTDSSRGDEFPKSLVNYRFTATEH